MPETQQSGGDHKYTDNKKKRRSRPWLWWVLYGVLVLTGMAIGSCYFKNGADRAKFWVEGLLSAGVLSVVIVQAVIYRKQWRAMELQTEYANRAYVCIPVANMDIFTEIETRNDKFVFKFRVENTGNTPANNVRVIGGTGVTEEDIPDPALRTADKNMRDVGLIAPKGHVEHWFKAPELTSEQNKLWGAGKLKIYCSGVITYKTFGKTRTTKFCLLRRVASMKVEYCGKWNEAD